MCVPRWEGEVYLFSASNLANEQSWFVKSSRLFFFFLLYFAWPSSQDSLCAEREPRPTPAAPGLALPDNPEGRTGTPDQLARAFSMEYENRVS